jgi:hypothetical protein
MLRYTIFLGVIIGILVVIYYLLVMLQCFGVIRFSKEEVSFPKILIPFYYFFK